MGWGAGARAMVALVFGGCEAGDGDVGVVAAAVAPRQVLGIGAQMVGNVHG